MSRDRNASCLDGQTTGMAYSVLTEVGRRLEALATRGECGAIDLRSLPLTDADRAELESLLGRGEVTAELRLTGRTEIWETRYAGAWWIRHLGGGDRVASELISVCFVPDILNAHTADVQAAARRLQDDLEGADAPPDPESPATLTETPHV